LSELNAKNVALFTLRVKHHIQKFVETAHAPRPDQVADEEYTPPTPTIKSGNRYVSKVDWSSDRVKNQVQGLLAHGKSLSYIARYLGVVRSTLTEANKRHNYRLYIPDLGKDG